MEKSEEKPQAVLNELVSDIEDVTNQEHKMSFAQAIKLYPKAVAWSVMMSTALIMDGYDLKVRDVRNSRKTTDHKFKLIGSLFAQPAFRRAYGTELRNKTYQISAPWQSGLTNGSNVGQMLGLAISGYVCERFGFRKTMMVALAIVPCIVFIQFFATSLGVLETAQVLLGIVISFHTFKVCAKC